MLLHWYESVILIKYGWKSERVWGQGVGVGGNMSGLVWVMEWTSVLVIIMHISKKEKTKQNKTAKHNTGKQRGRAVQQMITDKVSCFIVLIFLKTN